MFADPAVITVAGNDISLNKINQDKYSSEYLFRSTTQEMRVNIRNTSYTDKRRGGKVIDRHNVELIGTVYPVAPATVSQVAKMYVVFEVEQGSDLVAYLDTAHGFLAFLTDANITKLLGNQS